jgi:CHAT domain-containing protein
MRPLLTRFRVVLVLLLLVAGGAFVARRMFTRTVAPRPIEGRFVGLEYGTPPVHTEQESPRLLSIPGGGVRRSGGEEEVLTTYAANAVEELRRCTVGEPANDRCWSDLAAAEVEFGRQRNDIRVVARALAAADRALEIAPGRVEAMFNRAVALEALSLREPALVAWRRYLTADSDSPWAAEVRERIRALDKPTSMEIWTASLPELERAVARGDAKAVADLVRAHPQDARFEGERRALSAWGEAVLKGDSERAAGKLAIARALGNALRDATGEAIVADAVAAIDAAPDAWIPILAEAHATYGKARTVYASREPTESCPLFEQSAAAFRRTRSPMHRMAEYYGAACLSDFGNHQASIESADRQLADTPEHYPALRAQLLWQRGVASNRLGLPIDAADAFTQAFELFDRQGERLNREYVRPDLCLSRALMGHDAEAWRLRLEGFRGVSEHGHARSLQTALVGAAASEAASGRWDVAFSFYKLAMERELEPANRSMLADSAVLHAEAAHRGGLRDQVERALTRAHAVVDGLQDKEIRANSTGRLRLVEGVIARGTDPRRAVELLTTAIDAARTKYSLADAHLERGRAWRALQREEEAIADFRAVLDAAAKREVNAPPEALRESYFTTPDAAAEELVDLLEKRGQHAEALAVADRSRTRALMPAANGASLDAARVPQGTVLAHYTALPDRLVIFVITNGGIERVRVNVSRDELRRLIREFNESIEKDDARAFAGGGRRLHELLIEPLDNRLTNAAELVIVPDTTIAAVPFAALQPALGKYLIDSKTVAYAASAAAFLSPQNAPANGGGVLAVGDPAFNSELFPKLARLPAARSEAQTVAQGYGSTAVLTGSTATPSRVLEAMQRSRIITLAAHAVLDQRDPSRSALLLATSNDDVGVLYLREIAALSIDADMVVLTGCRTSAVLEGTPPGLRSFALAFLAAGSRNVAGSLWDADDDAAQMMSRLFHERLRAGAAPAAALRGAQLKMLQLESVRFREPSAWAGYQLYRSGF